MYNGCGLLYFRQIDVYRREHELAMADVDNYLGNPINAFTLIKRLTTDLDVIQNRIKLGTGKAYYILFYKSMY